MKTPHITPGQPCTGCQRPLRPSKRTELQHPGTVSHYSGGKCARCHQRNTEGKPKKYAPKIIPGQPCKTCDRPLRPQKSKAADYPGTVEHNSNGDCASCANRKRHASKPKPPRKPRKNSIAMGQPCNICKLPMRPRRVPAAEAPGTVLHWAAGHCDSCHRRGQAPTTRNPDRQARAAAKATEQQLARFRKTQQLPERPANLTADELHTRQGLEALINDRRRRGVPPEGIIPTEEQDQAA